MTLEFRRVSVTAGGVDLVADVDLRLPPGTVGGIIGPNGSGKSTLLRCAYRVLRPSRGAVWLDGDDVARLRPGAVARRLAAVQQQADGDFAFTVAETVALGRAPHRGVLDRARDADRRVVARAMEQVGVTHLADRPVSTLSGGERQRVMVARALAQEPRYLLLDEPTNHLDIRHQLELMDLVSGLGVSVLVALHDLNVAAAYCDHLWVLAGGRVVAAGPCPDVLTADLVARTYGVAAAVVVHPGTGRPQFLFTSAASPHREGAPCP